MAEQPEPRAGQRWQRRAEARPHEIVMAALELFSKQGYTATRMEEVARRAGVTPGTVYRYFENKEALFKAVVYESMGAVFAYADRRLEEYEGTTAALFRELVHGWWEMVASSRFAGLPKLILAEAANFPDLARFYAVEVVQRARRIFRTALERGIARGEVRPELDVAQATRLAMAPLQYLELYTHSLLPFDAEGQRVEAYLEAHLDLFLRGIAAPGAE